MKLTFLAVLFPKLLVFIFFPGVVMPVCSYNEPTYYFSVYCNSLSTGTNGVTPLGLCCEAVVLQAL